MKVVKPGKLSVVTRCFEHQRRHHLGVSVLAFVPLTGPSNLLSEISLWTFMPARLEVPVLDGGVPKSRGEYLVDGFAHSPGGAPQPAVPIRVRVGALEKTLNVYGDRYWRGTTPTEPQPFSQMRLGWDRAYGGPDFPTNPLGKGDAEVEIQQVMIRPLPNVEYPRQLVDSPRKRPEPACMLPIDISWPQRTSLAGTYDGAWLENLFPGLAADVDWSIFNLAARDQQREGFWAPGESFRFDNMHPQLPVLEGQLPRYVARTFIKRKVFVPRLGEDGQPSGEHDEAERFTEIPLALQTLWFFPDAERAVMIFQGSTMIREEDGADVLALVAAAENEGQPRSVEHYHQALRDRMVDAENAGIAWLREHELLPEGLSDQPDALQSEEAELGKHEALMQKNMHNKAVAEAERARGIVAACGLDPDVHGPLMPEPPQPPPTPAELPALAIKLQAEAEAKAKEEKQWVEDRLQKVEAMVDELGIPGFTGADLRAETVAAAPVGPPTFTAAAQLASIVAMAADFRSRGTVVDELEEMSVDRELYARWEAAELKMREGYVLTAHLQSPAPGMDEALLPAARERVIRALAAGEDFASLNLTGADLSNMDLRGAKLAGAFFESARFDGTDLSDADLSGAVLAHASLRGTKLDRANLRGANLGGSKLLEVSAQGADLSKSVLAGADLSGASICGAKLGGADLSKAAFEGTDASGIQAEDAILLEAEISGARFAGAKLKGGSFIKLDLSGADLSGADLTSCTFLSCVARGANFSGATLTNARFVESCVLDEAKFIEAFMPRCFLRGTSMIGCELSKATLDSADLSSCDLTGARFYQAIARETKFEKADLSDAVMLSANLMHASFTNAIIRGVDLRACNLHGADMARIRSDERVQLDEALLTKVRVNPRHEPNLELEAEDGNTV
ncbi:DUF2169 family type VI secretion system accessory protein [Enhygromyxa salina]|uniref:Secreted effector protein pipB2 n=1 Tax=Enhygromyxa salina TaxID=215803 RepID=A0A2S9YYU5_9BACT|nr:DUF2169 domain-containing protein [Enhygromyxa salina]PRQ10247.1 Secreted effector protein pipB2 [Enhygromyxa salina]